MPLFGLTRNRTAQKKIVANLINELARTDKHLWRIPIEKRKALIASIRMSCGVPDDFADLDSRTIMIITTKEGIQTGNAFREVALWISDANEYVKKVGENRLCQFHKEDSRYACDIENIAESAEQFIAENGQAELCKEIYANQLDRQLPALANAFLDTIYTNFELRIQEAVSSNGENCHWGKVFQNQYDSYLSLRKEGNDSERKQRLLEVLAEAVSRGGQLIGEIIK